MFEAIKLKEFIDIHSKTKVVPIVQGIWNSQKNRKDHVLYQPLQSVCKNHKVYLHDFIEIMYRTMLKENGIGIAANQIGVPLQVFLIELDPNVNQYRYPFAKKVNFGAFINPRITNVSSEWVSFGHGCLSAKTKKMGQVASYQWIDYEALDPSLNPIKGRLSNMAAVIFQHEFRHLLGKTYVDQAKNFLNKNELYQKFDNGELSPEPIPCTHEVPHLLADYKIGDPIH